MDAFEILVLILAITLAVFLVLSIVVTVYVIKILRRVQNITQKAEAAVEYAQSATKTVAAFVSPAAVAQGIIHQIKKSFRK